MHRVVMEAKRRGVSIGAHPGFNDLWGFGRRRIDTKPADLEYMVAYQIGALQAKWRQKTPVQGSFVVRAR
jgi:5-oxoprolinase (ATP-hydrolysing) subunit A